MLNGSFSIVFFLKYVELFAGVGFKFSLLMANFEKFAPGQSSWQ